MPFAILLSFSILISTTCALYSKRVPLTSFLSFCRLISPAPTLIGGTAADVEILLQHPITNVNVGWYAWI